MKPAMTLVISDPDTYESRGLGAMRRCAATRLLSGRMISLASDIRARRKAWAKSLAEANNEFFAIVGQDDVPRKDAPARLLAIQSARRSIVQMNDARSHELGALKESHAAVSAAFFETIDSQSVLDLGERQTLAAGLDLTQGTLEIIDAAARDLIAVGRPVPDDVQDLVLAIAGLGFSGERLVSVASGSVEVDDHAGEELFDERADADIPF